MKKGRDVVQIFFKTRKISSQSNERHTFKNLSSGKQKKKKKKIISLPATHEAFEDTSHKPLFKEFSQKIFISRAIWPKRFTRRLCFHTNQDTFQLIECTQKGRAELRGTLQK